MTSGKELHCLTVQLQPKWEISKMDEHYPIN